MSQAFQLQKSNYGWLSLLSTKKVIWTVALSCVILQV